MRPEANRFALRAAWVIAITLWAAATWMWFDIRGAAAPEPVTAAEATRFEPALVAEQQWPPVQPDHADAASRDQPEPVRRDEPSVCGLAERPESALSERDVETYLAQQQQLGLQRAIEALRARGDPQSQALGWLLEVARSRDQNAQRTPVIECQPGADCDAKRKSMADSAYVQAPLASDRLLEQARSGDDPWIAQLGLLACDLQFGAPKGCGALSPRRLVLLDADNAAAWLELASRDASALDEALFRASQASRYESRWGQLAQRVDEALPNDVPPLQRLTVVEQAMGLMSAYGLAPSLTARRYCSETAVRDANRAQVCERLARTLANNSREAIDVLAGHSIGANLGWPAEPRQVVRDAYRAGAEAMKGARGETLYACAAIETQLKQFRETQRSGELAAAQRAVERSGLSVAELLRRADAKQAKAVAAHSTPPPTSAPLAR